ncbi:hypothetical protein [Arthrobacter burdickii]|uniref:Uncharacterized protein n=1 Tax=Arthrobacter burdickii TaxID=3035920 RepID=A0ABT8JWP3_9MICC|nr:hypothetical protein [Arthrobacter burdickii]MDN4609593.1 hypothetical protein [Arthrobacter burdickii]
MSGATLAKSTMTFGARFGVAAVALLVLGPLINTNFGVGNSLTFLSLPEIWDTAPAAVLVSLIYVVLLVTSFLLFVILVTASLIIRHSETSEESPTKDAASTIR